MATRTATASFELTASPKGALLLPNGDEFRLKGVVWGGANTKIDRVPFGLDQHDIEWFGHFLHSHGFNSVKLCFSHAAVLANKKITHSAGEDDEHIAAEHTLNGLSYTEMLLFVSTALHKHGLLVFLSADLAPTDAPLPDHAGLWYSDLLPTSQVIKPF